MEQLLTLIIFLPLIAAVAGAAVRASAALLRLLALGAALGSLGLSIFGAVHFDPEGGMQFVHIAPWIQSYGITYYVGVDALSGVVLLLVSLLMPLLYLYMWHEKRYGYWYNMMALHTGVMGAVLSLDLVLFYLFWEAMLLPVFIMIGRYGNTNHQYNAMKIVVMTIFGSMAMLLSMLYLGYTFFVTHGFWSFAYSDIAALTSGAEGATLAAAGFLLAFAIKIPLPLFHTWMAPAYGSSPTPAVVILSSIMAKLGVYGIWRFGFGLFEPTLQHYQTLLIAVALFGMIFYAIHAIMENNLRRMFAFSSGSHLSLILLGLLLENLYAWGGSLYLIATHALASAGVFIMIGLIFRRVRSISVDALGGIAAQAPKFAFFFSFFALAIVGLPGTGGFVAELLIIIGAFKYGVATGVLTATTMMAAITFVFWMLQRTLYGASNATTSGFKDLSAMELLIVVPLMILLLLTGVAPSLFTPYAAPGIEMLLHSAGGL